MALVAYDYSDSENEDEDEGDSENGPSSFGVLFSSLPTPKQAVVASIEEDDDDLINKSKQENDTKKATKKEPVKIEIPALANYESDEDDAPKKIAKAPVKATGLFAVLPAPKCAPPDRNAKFDANVIKQKNLVPRSIKTAASKSAAKRQIESDDEDEVEGQNFFSSIFTDSKLPATTVSSSLSMEIDSAKPVKDMNSKSNQYFANLIAKPEKPVDNEIYEEEEETGNVLNETAMKELCGKRRKRKKGEEIQVIDINAADVMPDPRDWKTKALTEEQPAHAAKKGEEPSLQSRRKHQITYLAYQAKVNEQELKNQWALNRMSRKQTQAKYGF